MQNKKGISLIVLVITIIVMIILAAAVVITLNNTGVINRASQAVDLTNEVQVQDLAALVWADAYMDGKRGSELETIVKTELSNQGVKETDWNITVTDTGVSITNKNSATGLGSLITSDNYGDTVDYSVTVDGTTYGDWQIYYHNTDYVYIIAKDIINTVSLDKETPVASLSEITVDSLPEGENTMLDLYEIFRVGESEKYQLKEQLNCEAAAQLMVDYANFSYTTANYKGYVVGAIGAPTLELFAEGWNAKGYSPKLNISLGSAGYRINDEEPSIELWNDGLYTRTNGSYWLASPADCFTDDVMGVYATSLSFNLNVETLGIRPVVCLKASIPATVGTTTDFSLVK